MVTQVLVGQGQCICPACSGGMESVAAAVVGAAGAAVVFCLDSFTSAAPGIVCSRHHKTSRSQFQTIAYLARNLARNICQVASAVCYLFSPP